MDWNDVRVLQLGRQADLASEALGVHARGKLWRQNLDHNFAAESCLVCDKHTRHPSSAELALERVGVTKGGLNVVAKIHWDAVAQNSELTDAGSAVLGRLESKSSEAFLKGRGFAFDAIDDQLRPPTPSLTRCGDGYGSLQPCCAADQAAIALLVREWLTPEDFELLYGPFTSHIAANDVTAM